MWVNSVALQRACITPETPERALGEIPHRDDGSVLGTMREWGAVDLISAVMPSATRTCGWPHSARPPITTWPGESLRYRTPGLPALELPGLGIRGNYLRGELARPLK
jgi:hypothetical protein